MIEILSRELCRNFRYVQIIGTIYQIRLTKSLIPFVRIWKDYTSFLLTRPVVYCK